MDSFEEQKGTPRTDENIDSFKKCETDQSAVQATSKRPRRHGGPRTAEGKRRSRQNARRHGFLSQISIEEDSRAKLDPLLRELWKKYQPVGPVEEEYVYKLTVQFLCLRELLAEFLRQPLVGGFLQRLAVDNGAPPLDLLLRYLTTFDKSIARTIADLERMQRARKGQPEPPTLNVKFDT